MLSALQSYDPPEAERILAGLTQRFLPDPGIDPPPALDIEQVKVYEQVMGEIRQRLHLPATDESREAKTKVLQYLNTAMTELILRSANIPTIKARLGQRGDLRPDSYKVKFGDSFDNGAGKRGIRRAHVESALRAPDAVEHLLRELLPDAMYPAFSLYLKHQGETGVHAFSLLVMTQREGDTQSVETAWRVYHADVDLSQARSPLEVLRAFTEVYGMEFQVGDSPFAKFFLYSTVPWDDKTDTTFIGGRGPMENRIFEQHVIVRVDKSSRLIVVSLAYAIDIGRYTNDLRRHGVHTS